MLYPVEYQLSNKTWCVLRLIASILGVVHTEHHVSWQTDRHYMRLIGNFAINKTSSKAVIDDRFENKQFVADVMDKVDSSPFTWTLELFISI